MPAAFSTLPHFRTSTASKPAFVQLMRKADVDTVRIAFFGDSRWTFPGGSGPTFCAALQQAFLRRFGPGLPETSITRVSNAISAGTSPVGLQHAQNSGSAGAYAASSYPPGQHTSANLLVNALSGGNGHAAYLATRNENHPAGANLGSSKVFDAPLASSGPLTITARIWGVTYAAGGENEFEYVLRDNNTTALSYFGTARTTGFTSMGLDAAGFALKYQDIPITVNSASNAFNFIVVSKNASPKGLLAGVQFIHPTKRNGVVCFNWSAGGFQSNHFLLNHGSAGPFYRDFPLDAVVFGYGTNDAVNNISAATFKTRTLANIDYLRSFRDCPIYLACNPFGQGFTSSTQAEYAGALNEIVDERPDVALINTRRIMEEAGMNAANASVGETGTPGIWLADDVHLTDYGQRFEGTAVADAIMALGMVGAGGTVGVHASRAASGWIS